MKFLDWESLKRYFNWNKLGPTAPLFAVVGGIYTLWAIAPPEAPPIPLLLLSPIFIFMGVLVSGIIAGGQFWKRKIVGPIATWIAYVLGVMVALIIVFGPLSLFFGWPADWRHLVSPTIVQRRSEPPETIKLTPHWGHDFLVPEYWNKDDGLDAKAREEKGEFLKWLRDGASADDVKLVVFTSDTFSDFYEQFTGTLRFTHSGDVLLYSAIAFLQHGDSYRQLEVIVPDNNQDTTHDSSANILRNIQINSGDKFLILAQIEPLAESSITAYSAEIVTRSELVSNRLKAINAQYP